MDKINDGDQKYDESQQMLHELMKCVKNDNVSAFNTLFEQMSNDPKGDSNFKTLLNTPINENYLIIEASKRNNLIIVKQLVKHDANILPKDKDGKNVMYWACVNNNSEMCEYLMQHGADPNTIVGESTVNTTPLLKAAFKGNVKMMQYLLNNGKHKHSLDWVCYKLSNFSFSIPTISN